MKSAFFAALMLSPVLGSLAEAKTVADTQKAVDARKIVFDFAACVVKDNYVRASEAILSNRTAGTIAKYYPQLMSGSCLAAAGGDGMILSLKGDVFRYALADALVNLDFATKNPTDFANKLPLAHVSPLTDAELADQLSKVSSHRRRTEIQQNSDGIRAIAWMSQFGECVVRQNPVSARLWLLTRPDGAEEISRINALRPAFATCLGKGTLNFEKFALRGAVAISYYRLAMATPQAIPGKTL